MDRRSWPSTTCRSTIPRKHQRHTRTQQYDERCASLFSVSHTSAGVLVTSRYCDPRLNWLQGMEMSFLLADLLRLRKTQAFLPHLFSPYGYSAAHTPFHSPPSQSLEDHDQTAKAISQQIAQLTLQNSGGSGPADESKEEKKQ